jgi:hypothetical protein
MGVAQFTVFIFLKTILDFSEKREEASTRAGPIGVPADGANLPRALKPRIRALGGDALRASPAGQPISDSQNVQIGPFGSGPGQKRPPVRPQKGFAA